MGTSLFFPTGSWSRAEARVPAALGFASLQRIGLSFFLVRMFWAVGHHVWPDCGNMGPDGTSPLALHVQSSGLGKKILVWSSLPLPIGIFLSSNHRQKEAARGTHPYLWIRCCVAATTQGYLGHKAAWSARCFCEVFSLGITSHLMVVGGCHSLCRWIFSQGLSLACWVGLLPFVKCFFSRASHLLVVCDCHVFVNMSVKMFNFSVVFSDLTHLRFYNFTISRL